jgi:hypothetical protein
MPGNEQHHASSNEQAGGCPHNPPGRAPFSIPTRHQDEIADSNQQNAAGHHRCIIA